MIFEKLRSIREDNDLTQKQMAEILKVSQPNYSRWENEDKIIPLEKLNDFCNYFHVSFDFVAGFSKNKSFERNIKKLNASVIGQRLKEARMKQNISQNKLSKMLNTTHSTISAYEHGKVLILTIFAYEICKQLNVSMDWLCGRDEHFEQITR